MKDTPTVGQIAKGICSSSKYVDLFYDTLYPRFVNLSKTLNLENGSWGVEAVVKIGLSSYLRCNFDWVG